MSRAIINARIPGATNPAVLVSTSESLTGATPYFGALTADSVYRFTVTGLSPDTQYHYGFHGSELRGKFRSAPVAGQPASFLIAASGDAGLSPTYPGSTANTSNAPTFDRIREMDPVLFMHMGDFHYRDINSTNVGLYRTAYRDVLANARQHQLYREVALAYVFDDHDYGPNDSDGTYSGKAAAQQAYREYVPHYPLPAAGPIYQTWVRGRVRFFMLDVRSERTPNGATDNSSKSMLGATQKQWLKDELLAATEPCIVLMVSNPWIEPNADNWSSFSTERAELAEFWEANSLTTRLLLVGADWHYLAADDGTNTQFDTGSANPGPPLLHFAPLDASVTSSGTATYSEGVFFGRKNQFGTIDFADSGTEITVTAKGWELNADGSTKTEKFSLVVEYPNP